MLLTAGPFGDHASLCRFTVGLGLNRFHMGRAIAAHNWRLKHSTEGVKGSAFWQEEGTALSRLA